MPPIIADPACYDKNAAFAASVTLCTQFLKLNGICLPTFVSSQGPIEGRWKDFGMYAAGTQTIWVNVKKSRPPTKTPGFSWTYTGYKADLTVPGIMAHETGHHVHVQSGVSVHEIRDAFANEACVSGYEPHAGEAFAEAVRLFILNPDLLLQGRPRRWSFLCDVVKVSPTHTTPWRDVLCHAHPRIIAAAESWIKKAG